MALKLTLKPREKIIVNGAVLSNGASKTTFSVENEAVILREKDILTEDRANTPAKRIYFCLQMAYLDAANERDYLDKANHLVRDFVQAVPTAEVRAILEPVGVNIAKRNYFQALKQLHNLIDFEARRLGHDG